MAIKKYNNLLNNTVSDSTKTKKVNTTQDKLAQAKESRKKLDSITAIKRADISRKKDSILDRNAASKGMTREQVRVQQKKDAKKPDATSCNLNDPNFKPTKCGISRKGAKESKANFKKA
jgi:hypothetical protein